MFCDPETDCVSRGEPIEEHRETPSVEGSQNIALSRGLTVGDSGISRLSRDPLLTNKILE